MKDIANDCAFLKDVLARFPDAVTVSEAVRDEAGLAYDMRVIYLNDSAREGQPAPEAAIGALCSELWPQMVLNGAFAACLRVLNGGSSEFGEFWWTESATYRPLGNEYRAVRVGADLVLWVLRDSADMARRMDAEQARFRAAFDAAPAGVALIDLGGRIVLANESLAAMAGREREALPGRVFASLLSGSDGADVSEAIAALIRDVDLTYDRELRLERPGGTEAWARVSLALVRQADGVPSYCVAHVLDVTPQKALENALSHQALHDRLTGLPNRALLYDRLGQALVRLARHLGVVGLLFIDIDQFKVVNDGLGHAAGDALLVAAAERLKHATRLGDAVTRFGGDEFVVICDELRSEADAMLVATRVQEAFRAPFEWDEHSFTITLSMGIATATTGGVDAQSLVRDANVAMYRAKEEGRNRCVYFSDSLRAKAVERMQTVMALREAVARDELRLHYQPIVDLVTGKIVGVEALVRWQHPERGLLSPDAFIPIAEETGLIVPIGTWVLQEACRQSQRWHDRFPAYASLRMSINLSAGQIIHPGLVGLVAEALAVSSLDSSTVVLEVTESVLMADPEKAGRVLKLLKALGLRLSVDDFGTGYSSLTYLKRFPIDILKVDRSFVAGLGEDSEDSAIVAATVGLAGSLGLQAIAEGVETENQMGRLVDLACPRAQGYFFSRPMPADAIAELLEHDPSWDTHWSAKVPLYA
ncbi:MAG: EAL domain-containing protein [Deltaproteobacteria bacterium]|nr:EAL domain-containing protein [Deltaproteobacteria bacterium]